jgi:hypothetical protein
MRSPLRLLIAALLGVWAASLASCGGSGRGLIPEADAGPLRADFEAVAQAAQSANGSCTGTETALEKTETDFRTLPGSVDGALRARLQEGISNLRQKALAACAKPPSVSTATSTQTTTSTPTQTTSTATSTPQPTTTAPPPANPGGGTPAEAQGEGEGEAEGQGAPKGKGKGKGAGKEAGGEPGESDSGGASAGGAGPGGGQ